MIVGVGIDVGATYTKAFALDEDKKVIGRSMASLVPPDRVAEEDRIVAQVNGFNLPARLTGIDVDALAYRGGRGAGKSETLQRLFDALRETEGLSLEILPEGAIQLATIIYLKRQGVNPPNIWSVPWWLVLGAIAFAIVVSLASGIYPASRAARLDPVEALRYE